MKYEQFKQLSDEDKLNYLAYTHGKEAEREFDKLTEREQLEMLMYTKGYAAD
jgi:hypothetical protein